VTAPRLPESSFSPWLRPREAAAYARCSTRVIYQAIRSDRLRAARFGAGRSVVIRRDWVDEYLERLSRIDPIVSRQDGSRPHDV
jgi:excisionase family DNA binding protein